jgi:hypothetical protein
MISKSRLSWWTGDACQPPLPAQFEEEMHTTIKNELQLHELRINDLRIDRFVSQTHSNMFHFNKVALQRIV